MTNYESSLCHKLVQLNSRKKYQRYRKTPDLCQIHYLKMLMYIVLLHIAWKCVLANTFNVTKSAFETYKTITVTQRTSNIEISTTKTKYTCKTRHPNDTVTTKVNNTTITVIEVDVVSNNCMATERPYRDAVMEIWRARGYDAAFLSNVNKFWLSFDPPSDRTYLIFSIVYLIIAVVGSFGNSFVIYMFIRFKSLRVPSNMLVLNLAISDLIMLAKCPIAIYNNYKGGPALGYKACIIYGFVGGLSGTATILTLTAIGLDRYYVVVYPLQRHRNPTKMKHTCIPFIWLYSFFFAGIPTLNIGLSSYTPEGFLTTCSFDYLDKGINARIFMLVFFVAAWVLPLIIICHSYTHIAKAVWAARNIQSNRNTIKTEQKLACIILLIIGLWFIAWTPYTCVALSGILSKEEYLSPTVSMIPALFCKVSACIDPYIYAISHPRFRQEIRRLFLSKRGEQRRISNTTCSTIITRSSMVRRIRSNCETGLKDHPIEFQPTLPILCEMPEPEHVAIISDHMENISYDVNIRIDIESNKFTEVSGIFADENLLDEIDKLTEFSIINEKPKYLETGF